MYFALMHLLVWGCYYRNLLRDCLDTVSYRLLRCSVQHFYLGCWARWKIRIGLASMMGSYLVSCCLANLLASNYCSLPMYFFETYEHIAQGRSNLVFHCFQVSTYFIHKLAATRHTKLQIYQVYSVILDSRFFDIHLCSNMT